MTGYSARQLISYYAHCRANPDGLVLPPGGHAGWDDMTAEAWLDWFRFCLQDKIGRGTKGCGKGNAARKRIERLADAKAECKWCGTPTGHRHKGLCSPECGRSYNS